MNLRDNLAASEFAEHITNKGRLMSVSADDKERISGVWFESIHEHAVCNLPFGAGQREAELSLKAAIRATEDKFKNMGEDECRQAYGFAPLTLLLMLPSIWSFFEWIRDRFFGSRQE